MDDALVRSWSKLGPAIRSLIVLAIVIIFAFWPCLSAGFLNWDDPVHLLNNPYLPLRNFFDVWTVLSTPDTANHTYIPLTVLSFGIEQMFWGLKPLIFHLDNILLHILTAVMVAALG